VVGTKDEVHATAGWNEKGTVEYIAFTRKDLATGWDQAFVRIVRRDRSTSTMRVNRSGTADVGGMFFGPQLLYSRAPNDGDWDIRVLNLRNGKRHAVKAANTGRDEHLPTRSGRYLLFNRDDGESGFVTRIVLRDLKASTDAETVLARTTGLDDFSYAGQMRRNWAVWTKCDPVCDVYRRDIAAGITTKLAKPAADPPLYQYDASVGVNGTVYLARSSDAPCDGSVELIRYSSADPPEGTPIAQIAPSRFTTLTYARPNPDGSTDIFYSRGSCSTFRSNIYKVTEP
jgi:hypothetical protein